MNHSEYFQALKKEHPDVATRYLNKIAVINGADPYLFKEDELDYAIEDFPPVSMLDLYGYLVLSHSYYTKEQLKAYKSLEAYKLFNSGFIQNCAVQKIGEYSVIIGKVKHSQKMNLPPLRVWLLIRKDGSIDSAHCTCIAGAGEVCSHVAAILYMIENITKSKESTSCTDVKAQWKIPSFTEVPMCRIIEMKWSLTDSASDRRTKKFEDVPALEGETLVNFLNDVKNDGETAAIMAIIEPFASEIASNSANEIESFYPNLYKAEYEKLNLKELIELGASINYNITEDECNIIYELTKKQHKTEAWYKHRAGRITASNFKRVCRTKIEKPSISLLKCIFYPLKMSFNSKYTKWGINHEDIARKCYIEYQVSRHQEFQCSIAGLVISTEEPFLGVSPDGIIQCHCCGKGCLEIKCPYLLKTKTIENYIYEKKSCLEYDNNILRLKRSHSYYYQIQLQINVCKVEFCDFVVWSPKGFFIERITKSDDFWESQFPIAKNFFNKVVIPELLGRFFTKNVNCIETWCVCEQPDDGRAMVQCDNDDCEIKWYHMDCIGMVILPDSWMCKKCVDIYQ